MRTLFISVLSFLIIGCDSKQNSFLNEEKKIEGLQESVEILRDQWGINHIFANNQKDLFFAQGYAAAKDRLFQFEIWRRQATGTVAEILGPDELARDIGMLSKSTVNASHCEIINNIFSPTKEQLEQATSHVEVFEKARKLGQGQVDFDGIRIEMPTYLNALEVIKRFNELKQFS